jgi:hypothetical protein
MEWDDIYTKGKGTGKETYEELLAILNYGSEMLLAGNKPPENYKKGMLYLSEKLGLTTVTDKLVN